MAIKYHQISLKESFSDCKNMFMDDAPSFFKIMEQHFDIDQFVPPSFYMPSISIWDEKGIIRLPVSFPH